MAGDGAVFVAFPPVNVQDSTVQIDVLHPQAEDLALAHPGAVSKFRDEPPRVLEVGDDRFDFVAGVDGRWASLTTATDDELQREVGPSP